MCKGEKLMKDLSVAQEYLLCSLNEKGSLPTLRTEPSVCFVAAVLYELLSNDFVHMEGKNIFINKEIEPPFHYLRPMYDFIYHTKHKTIISIVDGYTFSISNKNYRILFHSVGEMLVLADCAEEKIKTGLFSDGQKYFIPKRESQEHVIQKIRAELLEDSTINDETIALVTFLNKGGFLNQYFSKYESQKLKERINEIKDLPPNKMVKQMLDYVDGVIASMVSLNILS
jgi:hypothetical protein